MLRTIGRTIASLTSAALLLGGPAAGTPTSPEISDIAGDANFVNGQALGPDTNVATSPASIDSADIRAMWLETAYDTIVTEVAGVRHIRYEPKALLVNVKTTAPPSPTFGPSVIFRFPAFVGGCSLYFELWVKGSAPNAVNRQYASIVPLSSCPSGGTITQGLSLSIANGVATATVPFSASRGMVGDGIEVGPSSRAHVRVVLGADATYCCTVPAIDEAPLGTSFVIGSDVPADVDCSKTPEHPGCA